MSDQVHLNELLAKETGIAAQTLLDAFKAMVRDPAIDPQEYPARLRQVMDELLKGLANAPAQPDRP